MFYLALRRDIFFIKTITQSVAASDQVRFNRLRQAEQHLSEIFVFNFSECDLSVHYPAQEVVPEGLDFNPLD
jgi:hypothetical protein